ncbi:MAG TPA: EAL domain-containing protein [Pyrinomonadaceae bacterium]|nr:EAL domain-containing protein [Pyrinomonadaceae bacterium]
MKAMKNAGRSQLIPAAVTAAGLALWAASTLLLIGGHPWREQLIVLSLVPLVGVISMFPNTFSLPSGLTFSQEKISFTFSDAVVLLAAVRYGLPAAVFVAGVEGFISSRRTVRRLSSNLYSFGMMSLTAAAAAASLKGVVFCLSGDAVSWEGHSFSAVAVSLLAASIVHVVVNTGLTSALFSVRLGQPFVPTWKGNLLWAVPMFLPTGAAAALMYAALRRDAFVTVVIGGPILAAIYLGHRQNRKALEKAESAERERAEQAERHVLELRHYVNELERTSGELRESKEHFRHAAFHDSLTGLPNRAWLIERLKSCIERAAHGGHNYAVLFLDLDRFKNVNDSLGHNTGDRLLVATARRLADSVRESDTVARLGGDEFAILLDGVEAPRDATSLAERVQSQLKRPFTLGGHEVYSTASIGIAFGDAGYAEPENVLRDADTAMYRAKEHGKACFQVFDQAMHSRAVNLLKLETDLRRAVEREELAVHYQPVVDLRTGRLAGFEALVRWEHPERGFISPSEFIPVAEDTMLVVPLGEWVLREACRQMCRWHWLSPDNGSLTLSVNISGKQLAQPRFVEQVEQVLAETHLNPHSLKLEITESVLMENTEAATGMLLRLKALGIQLSIDDFGTGYSSLSYLHRFPVDALKIDRSFVTRMGAGDENTEIVRTIRTLAENMRMEVVAEGVENLYQLKQLTDLNCEYGQGYLFSKPATAAEAEALIARKPDWLAGAARPLVLPDAAHANVTHLKFA